MLKIEANQQKRNNAHPILSMTAGAVAGAGLRQVLPTKQELSTLKTNADTFFSSASRAARTSNRTITKYAGVGALVAGAISIANKIFKKPEDTKENTDTFEYSKYDALIDAPEYAAELLIYGE